MAFGGTIPLVVTILLMSLLGAGIPLLVIVPLQSVLLKRHKGKPVRKGQMAVMLSYRGSFLGRSRKQRQYVSSSDAHRVCDALLVKEHT